MVPHRSFKKKAATCDHTKRTILSRRRRDRLTTFKEFVEEKDLTFSLLDFGFPEYRSLVEASNKAKLKLEAEEETREYERERARLMLNERSATKDLRSRRAQRPKSDAGPQP